MANPVTLDSTPNTQGAAFQNEIQLEEEQVILELLGKGPVNTQMKTLRRKWSPMSIVEKRVTPSNGGGNAGSSSSFPVEKDTDVLMHAAVEMQCPMIADALALASVSSAATVYYNDTAGALPSLSLAGGVAASATSALNVTHVRFDVTAHTAIAVGDYVAFTGATSGLIAGHATAALGTDTAGDLPIRLLSATPVALAGAVTWAVHKTAAPAAAGAVTAVVGTLTWTVDATGSALTTRTPTVAAGTVFTNTGMTTAFAAADLTLAFNDGIDGHSAYYVNGAPCAAISSLSFKVGGLVLLEQETARSLRIFEKLNFPVERWNEGAIGNWGTKAQLQQYAHRNPLQTATNETRQFFYYDLPVFFAATLQDGFLNNASGKVKASFDITFGNVSTLVRSSDATVATDGEAQQVLAKVVKRGADHLATSAVIANSDISFALVLTYGHMLELERKKYNATAHALFLRNHARAATGTVSNQQANSYGSTPINVTSFSHPAEYFVACAQPLMTRQCATNGVGDIFSYKQALSDTIALAESTLVDGTRVNPHVPCVSSISFTAQGSRRVTDFTYEHSLLYAARMLPAGKRALEDGLVFFPFSPQKPNSFGDVYGTFPFGAVDNGTVDVAVHPGSQTQGGRITCYIKQVRPAIYNGGELRLYFGG